jgi:hypothetical protein
MNRHLLFLAGGLMLFIAGCQKRMEPTETVFQADDDEHVLTIALDMSASFSALMAEDGKAWSFVCQLIDRYFRDRVGHNDRLVLAQLSGSNRPLLWSGTSLELRQEFPSASEFRKWLISKADPKASHVYEGIVQAVDYTLSESAVASGKGKAMVIIISDMIDNTPDNAAARIRAVSALAKVGKSSGAVGLYYVDVRLCPVWNQLLRDAGVPVRNVRVQADIVGRPQVPSFE